ncbi:hypothetical protein D3C83_176850 [compost metagenome]
MGSATEEMKGQPRALHGDDQRGHAEEGSMERIAILAIQMALAERASGGHEHRLVWTEQQQ